MALQTPGARAATGARGATQSWTAGGQTLQGPLDPQSPSEAHPHAVALEQLAPLGQGAVLPAEHVPAPSHVAAMVS